MRCKQGLHFHPLKSSHGFAGYHLTSESEAQHKAVPTVPLLLPCFARLVSKERDLLSSLMA